MKAEFGKEFNLSPTVCEQGSSVQLVQEKLLRQHGILWRHLKIDMVRTNK